MAESEEGSSHESSDIYEVSPQNTARLPKAEQLHIQHAKQSTKLRVNSYICQSDQTRNKPLRRALER